MGGCLSLVSKLNKDLIYEIPENLFHNGVFDFDDRCVAH